SRHYDRVPSLRAYAAKADLVVARLRRHVMSRRRTGGVRGIVPVAAANDALLGAFNSAAAAVGRRTPLVGLPIVGHPLPVVAVHVVIAPGIGLLFADGRIKALRVRLVPAERAEHLQGVAVRPGRGCSRPASVLPLGFARQANGLLGR